MDIHEATFSTSWRSIKKVTSPVWYTYKKKTETALNESLAIAHSAKLGG